MARRRLPDALKEGRAEVLSHDQEKLLRREEAVQRQLNAAVERYAAALELFDQKMKEKQKKAQCGAAPGVSGYERSVERRCRYMRRSGCGREQGVDDFSDCAAFSLATPRLGLLAHRRGLARFVDLRFAIAMRLLLIQRSAGTFGTVSVTLSEVTLRKYAGDCRASADHFPWLASVSPAYRLSSEFEGAGEFRKEDWRLRRGEEVGAKLRTRFLQRGSVYHFEGERGAERMVRQVFDGTVFHFEGEPGAERMVRQVAVDGMVLHFEGERGAERKLRTEYPDGDVLHYEGERGAERKVRECIEGMVIHYDGEKGMERMVRAVSASGDVHHYEGERDAERVVRTECVDGEVFHHEGSEARSGGCAR
ncbi:Hypothetical protein EMIHUDRAFT_109993 [Emiliania huxleyi CCMP1516]|uniref:Centromere protein J C-terminal domain-containing protein n=2 Tax=Emiliania huxleyi TaxID=2903 RepID=A0A0D3KN46_EMIH1|nr:Hypothetical protein EMIHUDRAFT_109993 [Emiliania huxleyi CCMP1516]EOD37181.1 Hypothetical protein EMIHUDRAFT_109993 [Emiliania huxleyi CCMP1516]|eukprot:XP_005789610.1 Hypothetical protein EMIHUDRAFT_109993 [Emiliania huxleyi CCMP1516]